MVPISALRKLAALFLSRGVASLPKHSALVLSLEEQPSTPWNLSYGEPPPGFYHGSSLIMAGGLKCFSVLHLSQSNGFSFSHVFSYCLPQVIS